MLARPTSITSIVDEEQGALSSHYSYCTTSATLAPSSIAGPVSSEYALARKQHIQSSYGHQAPRCQLCSDGHRDPSPALQRSPHQVLLSWSSALLSKTRHDQRHASQCVRHPSCSVASRALSLHIPINQHRQSCNPPPSST